MYGKFRIDKTFIWSLPTPIASFFFFLKCGGQKVTLEKNKLGEIKLLLVMILLIIIIIIHETYL